MDLTERRQMQRFFLPIAVALLAGCTMETPQMSPAVQQLNMSCRAGDTEACKAVANIEMQDRAARMAMVQQMNANTQATMQANNELFMNNRMRTTQTTNCVPNYTPGGMRCTTY